MRPLPVALVALVALSCGGASSVPPGPSDGGNVALDASGGPFAGHPLVGTWEALSTDPRDVGTFRRTFTADGRSTLRGRFGRASNPTGCFTVSESNTGTWAPAGEGAFTGSRAAVEVWEKCNGARDPRPSIDARDLEGRHTFTLVDGVLRIDPERDPNGYAFRRVQP